MIENAFVWASDEPPKEYPLLKWCALVCSGLASLLIIVALFPLLLWLKGPNNSVFMDYGDDDPGVDIDDETPTGE